MIVIVLEEGIDLLQKVFMVILPLKVVKFYMVIVQFIIEKKSMTASDNTIQAEGLVDFFKNERKEGHNVSKKMA